MHIHFRLYRRQCSRKLPKMVVKLSETKVFLETLIKSSSSRRYILTSVIAILALYFVISVLHTDYHNYNLVTEETSSSQKDSNDVEFIMDTCKCKRKLKGGNPNIPSISYNQTTCGRDAFRRGTHQKIVGFSFYGDIHSDYSKKKGYFQGIIGNLKLMPRFYPGWVMRLYYDLDKKDPVFKDLCDLACSNPNIDICDAKHLPGTPFVDCTKVFAMNWRFFPTLDPQVSFLQKRAQFSVCPCLLYVCFSCLY